LHRGLVDPVGKADRGDTDIEEGSAREQRFGAAVERLRMQHGVAGAHEGQQRRRDRRHA
jgi:hypothetical protein